MVDARKRQKMNRPARRLPAAVLSAACACMLLAGTSLLLCAGADLPSRDTATAAAQPAPSGPARGGYARYLEAAESAARPADAYELYAGEASAEQPPEMKTGLGGSAREAVLSAGDRTLTWRLDVREAGLYSLWIEYYPVAGKSSVIERALNVNGEIPFENAAHFKLYGNYTNADVTEAGGFRRDGRGNDIRPSQQETPVWTDAWFSDYLGFVQEPYSFYLKAGENVVSLSGVQGDVWIGRLVFRQPDPVLSYADLEKLYGDREKYPLAAGAAVKIQGEWAAEKTDPMLYPVSDRSSPTADPYSALQIRLNGIGGEGWKTAGQKITWVVEAPESGLYRLGIKYRQNYTRGLWVTRKLTVDGKLPFAEASDLRFEYGGNWNNFLLGGDGGPQYIYLEKGERHISLEVAIGSLGEVLTAASDSVTQLNYAYRQLLMIIGSQPDQFRDYQLRDQAPEALRIIGEQAKVVRGLADSLFSLTGRRGTATAIISKLAAQLEAFSKDDELIQRRWLDFKSNLSSFAEWSLNLREQPLQIDYLMLLPEGAEMPGAAGSFLQKLWHEVVMLSGSFIVDYNSIGNVYDKKDAVTVWIQSGRDQAQLLRGMIDNDFTPGQQVPVNLQLVQGVLLQAIVSGRAPDIALGLAPGDPMNLAIRGALADLTAFPEFPEIRGRFYESAFVPFIFRGSVYALPETQTFPMMFIRTDILEELGVAAPQTWDDLLDILPVIQNNNMDIGLENDAMNSFTTFLYQYGAQLYDGDGRLCVADSEAGARAFKSFTSYFLDFDVPLTYNFVNRFRTGEMPLAVADYAAYNTLSVFAPEIRGLWKMLPVPGVEQDGKIDRSVAGIVSGCVMTAKSGHKDAAWRFMQWWTSAGVQRQFGREMESLLGVAARYTTANREAAESLSWASSDIRSLTEQWGWTKGNPEVPGGYFTGRHLNNAFRRVIYQLENPGDALTEYVDVINQEIQKKRKEFRLDGGR